MLSCALIVFLTGKRGAIIAALITAVLMKVKDLTLLPIIATGVVLIAGILLERPVQNWAKARVKGALFSGFMGSLILLTFYGIFLGPFASLAVWFLTSGLKILPQFQQQPGWLPQWANTLYRGGLSLSLLALGLYTVYAG